jgi:uncharacterized protein DUF6600/FecR-like protein
MKRLSLLSLSLSLLVLGALMPQRAHADASHARIVRLSLVQGEVRFAREFHKDSLEDAKAAWEIAPLNLPIRQGYALATDANGRAEVEFENGAMAFLSANTLIEFYDLSLDDGAHITRLILRQGSAIFYVHPAQNDYFSVTGGDFSVEANGRTRFRVDNFDDGSNVSVEQGQISVLRNKSSKPLQKGQSYSININEGNAPVIARIPDSDDFDKWVSGRIDSVATATTYANQYVNSPDYTSGFADLYNYGSFYNVPGYGYGWQPYGVGLGWNPFAYGSWYSDPFLGWNFIGSAPWGWLPYHYGGWIFSPVNGWVWMPTGFGYGGPIGYRPITAVWVRSGTTTGLVPVHPADGHGKTPINLAQGVYTVHGNTLEASAAPAAGERWSVVKNPPRDTLTASTLAATTQPTRVSRTILSGNYGSRAVTLSRDSSIVYDANQHRFVNGNASTKVASKEAKVSSGTAAVSGTEKNAVVAGAPTQRPNAPTVAHGNTMPARPHINPPTPPSGNSSHTSSGAPAWGNTSRSSASSMSAPSSSSSHSGSPAGGHSSGGGHH